MRLFTLFTFALLFSGANAQSFAPQGATWHYKKNFFFPQPYLEHYSKLQVVGDTLINGVTCSKIQKEYPFFCNLRPTEEFVYASNDTVFFYDTTFSQFQILYDFNAVQGDSWVIRVNGFGTANEDTVIVNVDSTDFVTINSQTLKRLYVNYTYYNDGVPIVFSGPSEVIERIGDTRYLFEFANFSNIICDGDWTGGLRCYEDSIIGFYDTGISDSCEYFEIYNDLEEQTISSFTIAPNPSEKFITVNMIQGSFQAIQIFDSRGRLIIKTNSKHIDISTFNSGLYIVRVKSSDTWSQQRFIKY